MSGMQDGVPVQQCGSDTAGQDRLAVQGVREGDDTQRGGNAPAEHAQPQSGTVASDVPDGPEVSPETAWIDGRHVVAAGLIYRTYLPTVFSWGTKQSPEGKGRVGIYAVPVNGDTIWHYAICSCLAGCSWRSPCAHKAAAFILARNLGTLPVGFPDF